MSDGDTTPAPTPTPAPKPAEPVPVPVPQFDIFQRTIVPLTLPPDIELE